MFYGNWGISIIMYKKKKGEENENMRGMPKEIKPIGRL